MRLEPASGVRALADGGLGGFCRPCGGHVCRL